MDRSEEILCDALEIESEADRHAFVVRACEGDAQLREKVEEMLRLQDDSNRLFDAIGATSFSVVDLSQELMDESARADGSIGALPDDSDVGSQIGPYTLIRKIGEGGCGNVYLAEQEKPVRRQVALKIIKQGMDTKTVIARFEAERQALAMMEHPNIAHVLNAGETGNGRPYFVMELVHGVPVTDYCEAHKLDIPHRLELFIQVCHAIQHAHQKGIIHRDIKPSNVLVVQMGGYAVPKVIDFGIAKATGEQQLSDRTAFTMHEQFVGTPAYMSPEQADRADMDIDIRSDIYSLGVLLYELLTGKTPFDQKKLIRSGVEEMRRTIRTTEPPRPSAKLENLDPEKQTEIAECRGFSPLRLTALLKGDLDWIVMKALDKDRSRRYQSADGFAEDLQRYLRHEPTIARPPSRFYRFSKLVRRNKGVFAVGSVAVAILLVSSTISTWLLIRERITRQRAVRAEQEKGLIQQQADDLRSSVEQLAEASILFRQGNRERADAMLERIRYPQASPENASVYRELGDWHALNGRWDKAKARFDVLTRINEFEATESTKDDIRFSALLVEQGHLGEYERFRESMIARYAGMENPRVAQRVLQHSLLVSANEELMIALEQFARVTEQSYRASSPAENDPFRQWQACAMSIFCYRQGNLEDALSWSELALSRETVLPTRDFSVKLIQSCILYRMGQVDKARMLLQTTRSDIDWAFAIDPAQSRLWLGFWFDRACVRIYLREAEETVDRSSRSTD